MFDPTKIQEMIAQAQSQAADLQKQMASTIVEAAVGGGAVTVKMNGSKRLIGLRIEPDALKSGDVEMLQDLITAAVNEAGRKVDDAMQATVGGMMSGLMGGGKKTGIV